MIKKLMLASIIVCAPSVTHAQEHDHKEHSHEDKLMELGVSIGPSYVLDRGFALSVHSHLVWFIPHTPVGLGVGYERLFGFGHDHGAEDHGEDHGAEAREQHNHNTISFVSQMWVTHGWSFVLAPGITFDDNADELSASMHVETVYEFELTDNIHLGPAFEIAFDKDEIHMTPALHGGLTF